ncbi:hypothetical protein [Burkholderia sp. FERM BP-3421]|jgi:hypothetical protein|nr:hypothetical protein [Burkholderia sp. FERM BP-3421]
MNQKKDMKRWSAASGHAALSMFQAVEVQVGNKGNGTQVPSTA